ncbi:MAG: hypothetical protein K2M09_02815, partial [Muribaculaceae bacterium]|nr:hypothetical protein [Muribaculaceae bacterium]
MTIGHIYAITRPNGRAYVLTTRYAGLNPMERRIPIRRLGRITGLRGALATMERKLHGFRLKLLVVMALTRHRGEGATVPGGLHRVCRWVCDVG